MRLEVLMGAPVRVASIWEKRSISFASRDLIASGLRECVRMWSSVRSSSESPNSKAKRFGRPLTIVDR